MNDYLDIEVIINAVYDEYGFEVNKAEIVDQVYKVMSLMNNPDDYDSLFSNVTIVNYRGNLPSNIHSIESVLDLDTGTTLIASLDLFSRFSSISENDIDTEEYVYAKKDNYIFTGLENANIEISYKAFPTINGLPAIPNDAKALRMVVEHISNWKAFGLFRANKLNRDVYLMINQNYLFAKASYSTHSKIPDMDTMAAIKNRYLKYLESPLKNENGFKSQGYRSRRRF